MKPSRRAFLLGGVAAAASRARLAGSSGVVELEALIPTTTWAPGLVTAFNARTAGRINLRLEQVPYNQLNEKIAAYIAAGRPPDVARAFTGYTRDWQAQGLIDPVDDTCTTSCGLPWRWTVS